jgi:hypothetical protein
MKLTPAQRHLFTLAKRDATSDGWTPVSAIVWPYVAAIPDDLLEKREGSEGRVDVRLTPEGRAILRYT